MEDMDELIKHYPEFKSLIQDTRQELFEINQSLSRIPPAKYILDKKPDQSGMQRLQERQRKILENQKANELFKFNAIIEREIQHKDVSEQDKIKADLNKIIASEIAWEFDKKDVHLSQAQAVNQINRFKEQERNQSMARTQSQEKGRAQKFRDNARDIDIDI